MVIRILDHVQACDTADQGEIIRQLIQPLIQAGEEVTLSFDGVATTTTSFVNTAFIETMENTSPNQFRKFLRVSDATRQISDMVVNRVRRHIASLELQ